MCFMSSLSLLASQGYTVRGVITTLAVNSSPSTETATDRDTDTAADTDTITATIWTS